MESLPDHAILQPHQRADRQRLTIGLLTHGAGDPNNHAIWSGVADAAQAHQINLFCFPGKPLRSPHEFEAQANIVYDLVDPEILDGLIIWMAGIAHQANQNELKAFCERYRPLPIVTIGTLVDGFPGVVVDNENGMRAVIAHLLDVHGCRRVAFIRGPKHHQEAEQRYRAYRDALSEHHIPLAEELVVPGNFRESGGIQAVEELIDHRRVTFDALVAASDNMAIGAMKSLQSRGYRIPGDVLVAGLNDEAQSKLVSPALTTGPLHFYDQARQATEMILAILSGHQVPQQVIMPTRLLVRQSCGCPDPVVERAILRPPSQTISSPRQAEEIPDRSGSAEQFQPPEYLSADPNLSSLFQHLAQALLAETMDESDQGFLTILKDSILNTPKIEDVILIWNDLVSALRWKVIPGLTEAGQVIRGRKFTPPIPRSGWRSRSEPARFSGAPG